MTSARQQLTVRGKA